METTKNFKAMKNPANTKVTNSETKEKKSIIDFFAINEKGDSFAQINGKRRIIEKLNTGEYCFISKNKILEKTVYLGYFKKNKGFVNDNYANIFNETDQIRIKNYFNS